MTHIARWLTAGRKYDRVIWKMCWITWTGNMLLTSFPIPIWCTPNQFQKGSLEECKFNATMGYFWVIITGYCWPFHFKLPEQLYSYIGNSFVHDYQFWNSNFLVYNLQLPHITYSSLMVAMVMVDRTGRDGTGRDGESILIRPVRTPCQWPNIF